MIDAITPEKRPDDGCELNQLNQKRQVRLKTCADVYEHWRSYKRLYKKAPKDGVEFQIDYIDTGLGMSEEERAKAPIALALHGAPGSYHDFSLLIDHLAQQRVRVIAPNFPEYVATVKTKVLFRHSADEKAAYLRDFLKAIEVKTIDLLVSHSSASFPTLLILLNANKQAIERRNRQQQQQQQSPDGQSERVKVKRSEQKVHVDAFSNIGDQLRGNVADICNAAEPVERPDSEREESESDDEEDGGEPFEDASDQLDDNNNPNQEPKKRLEPGAVEELVVELKQLGAEGQQVEAETKRPVDKRKRAGRRRRRQSEDVIVHFDEPIEIKSVALFNPAGHRLPKSMKPTWFKCGSVHIYQHKLGRSLFRKFGPAFLTVVGVPVRVDNMDNVMLSATVMRNSKCQRVVMQLEELSQMKIPTLLVFSENDKLIEREIFYEMTQFMRLDPKKFDVFNNDGDIELSQSMMDDWIRVMVFKAGGHYAYSNYAKTVNKAVSELLARVVPVKKEEGKTH